MPGNIVYRQEQTCIRFLSFRYLKVTGVNMWRIFMRTSNIIRVIHILKKANYFLTFEF